MKNGNQNAFPMDSWLHSQCGEGTNPCGLTKREYFAGLAMQAILGLDYEQRVSISSQYGSVPFEEYAAKASTKAADALLAELEKPQP